MLILSSEKAKSVLNLKIPENNGFHIVLKINLFITF